MNEIEILGELLFRHGKLSFQVFNGLIDVQGSIDQYTVSLFYEAKNKTHPFWIKISSYTMFYEQGYHFLEDLVSRHPFDFRKFQPDEREKNVG